MQPENYIQPDTCIPGEVYFIKTEDPDLKPKFIGVKFIDYCPHPAEVIVREGGRIKVIHRIYLLQKNSRK